MVKGEIEIVCVWRKSVKKRSENRSIDLPLFRIAFEVTSPFSLECGPLNVCE